MNLSIYKAKFEKEFESSIKPNKNIFSYMKLKNKKHTYPLSLDMFYYKNPPITVRKDKSKINVFVEKNEIKTLYLSYLTLDTKFAEIPEKSFINLDTLKSFHFDVDISTTNSVEVIPFIIHYNNKGKKKMTRITRRNQLVEIAEDEIKCRLTFKIKGNGNFSIKSITRIE